MKKDMKGHLLGLGRELDTESSTITYSKKGLLHLIAAEPRNVLAYYKPYYYLKNSIKEIT